MIKFIFHLFLMAIATVSSSQNKLPLPTKPQLDWHKMEFYLFMHFGPNTFTGKEWGDGSENPEVFNPTQMDCRQWCRIAKAAGAKGIIITAKHHDGFCLWPSKYSTHTVRESQWKKGKGDVLKELSLACKEYGLKFGVYLSPWDRNHPKYGAETYNDVFVNMLKEVFTNYGPIWELWWDGANGEGPDGKKQVYDWKRFEKTVRSISPRTVIFSDIGPDVRWCGNENGTAGTTNWNFLDTAGFTRGRGAPSTDTLNSGNYFGKNWIPAECDVSIRPGWYYRDEENDKVKTSAELFDLYLKSVGRGANLLLNVPPDKRGLISKYDSASLVGFKKLKDAAFKKNILSQSESIENFSLRIDHFDSVLFDNATKTLEIGNYADNAIGFEFKKPVAVNCVVLKENLIFGQRVRKFVVHVADKNGKSIFIPATSIGSQRIITFPTVTTQLILIRILEATANPKIQTIDFYRLDDKLIKP